MLDVLCIGDINQDIITSPIKELPKKDEQLIINSLNYYLGGSSAICSAACAQLGLRTGFIGVIGNDLYGHKLRKQLRNFNVKSYLRQSKQNKTDTTLALTYRDGKRSFLTVHGANNELVLKDIKKSLIKQSRHLHLSGYWHLNGLRPDLNKLLNQARKAGLTTSLDVGSTIEHRNWPEINELLDKVNILFLNSYELKLLTKEKTLKRGINSLTSRVELLAVHLGDKGGMACTRNKCVKIKAYKTKVVNPTGAGDTFNAGFLKGYLSNELLEQSLRQALINATIYVSRSEQRFPTMNDVEAFKKMNN